MKKVFIVIMISILAFGLVSTCALADTGKKEFKFRDYDWGTTFEEIKNNEITSSMSENVDYQLSEAEGVIMILNQKVAGLDCTTYYLFDKDGLMAGGYMIDENHSNEQQYYTEYKSLVSKLTDLYGEPFEDQEYWLDDLYKGRSNKQGMAIITGGLAIRTRWKDDNENEIMSSIMGDNYDCQTLILYGTKDYVDSMENNENNEGL